MEKGSTTGGRHVVIYSVMCEFLDFFLAFSRAFLTHGVENSITPICLFVMDKA